MEVDEIRDAIEWNGMEQNRDGCCKETERTYEKALWAHRGLGHAHESAKYCTGDLGRTSGPGRSAMRPLESHAIPGVMLCGLSIVHERENKRKEKKNRPSELA